MVGLSVFIAIAFTRLPISRTRNTVLTPRLSIQTIVSKFQGYRCDTQWDTVCYTRQLQRRRCQTYGWTKPPYRSASPLYKTPLRRGFCFVGRLSTTLYSKERGLSVNFTLYKNPASARFLLCRQVRWMTVHDAILKRTRLIGQIHSL